MTFISAMRGNYGDLTSYEATGRAALKRFSFITTSIIIIIIIASHVALSGARESNDVADWLHIKRQPVSLKSTSSTSLSK